MNITYGNISHESLLFFLHSTSGLLRLQEVLKTPVAHHFQIAVRRLDHDGTGDYRGVLKEIRQRNEVHILLDCHYSKVYDILSQVKSYLL